MANKPTDGMKSEARKGLEWRKEFNRGGTSVGVARARDIVNGKELSDDTVKRMHSFFSRHEVDKRAEGFSPGEKGYPSAGRIAWALWGGDAGQSWARKKAASLSKEDGKMEYTNSRLELKYHGDEEARGTLSGYASLFNEVDQGYDMVAPGAFSKSLVGGRKVKMLWQHDPKQPIGVWDEIREDDRGLYVKGRILPDVQKGAEALALLQAGGLDGMSIGYRTKQADMDPNEGVRLLKEVDLFEISLVTFPMQETAKVTDVKSIATIREFERALRDAGFSQTEAKAIAAEGFKGLADHRDGAELPDEPEGAEAFFNNLQKLKESFNDF